MRKKPAFAVVLEKRTPNKDNLFPLKLRMTYLRKQRYISLGRFISAEDWQKAASPGARGRHQDLKIEIAAIEARALEICEDLPVFSFDLFREAWQGRRPRQSGVFEMIEEKAGELRSFGQVRTARLYQATARILTLYLGKKRLAFEQVRPDFLRRFEKWMADRGNSVSTRSIYLRNLQHVFNRAIDAGIVNAELYPFGRKGFRIQKARTLKRAIGRDDLQKIFRYEAQDEKERFYRDIWLLLYLTAANVKDIIRLRFRDIQDGKIVFYRAKTLNDRTHTLRPVVVVLGEHERRIIEDWSCNPVRPDSYIFPVLTPGAGPEKHLDENKNFVKQVNKYMQRIGNSLQIDTKITTYTARHTHATILRNIGAPIHFISESLGHADTRTTEIYLDSFTDSVKKEFKDRMTDFEEEE